MSKMDYIRQSKFENVTFLYRYSNNNQRSIGNLYLTATHLIFVDPVAKRETWILHSLISSVEKLPISARGSPLLMRCKHFFCITFIIPKEKEAHDIYQSLTQLSQPTRIEQLYCFEYTAPNENFTRDEGWNKFSLFQEFRRQNCPNSEWVSTPLNANYKLCDTYSQTLFVPASATQQIIHGSANFRSKSRLPILSYLHSNKASISRCAQPLTGFNGRCVEDERMLDCVRQTNPNSNILYLVDTRPKINAMVNKAQGKGFENELYYDNTKFYFFAIENIHVMRGSLQKLIDATELKNPSMSSFLSKIEESGWLRHVKSIMETALFVANAVNIGISAVIHCSDGWDRTSQTCALAALLLDPYYRTLDGFQILIEKDWLAYGHKFTDRCGHINGDNREMAPVLTQFLEVVWQISQQYPQAFEFNENYLIAINDAALSSQFGTFVGNCDKDRTMLRLSERTFSLWAFLDSHRLEYLNPIYSPVEGFLTISVTPQHIKFWRGLYNRFESGVHPRDPIADILLGKRKHVDSLKDQLTFLEKYHKQLEAAAERAKMLSLRKSENANKIAEKKPLGSIDLEDIDRPMRVVGECLQRLELQQQMKNQEGSDEDESDELSSATNSELNSVSDDVLTSGGSTTNTGGRESRLSRPNSLNIPSAASSQDNSFRASSTEPDVSEYDLPVELVVADFEKVQLQWQSFRGLKACQCSTPLEIYSTKMHCFACGMIFCIRCIDKRCPLPGHDSKEQRSVCRKCFLRITQSGSIDA